MLGMRSCHRTNSRRSLVIDDDISIEVEANKKMATKAISLSIKINVLIENCTQIGFSTSLNGGVASQRRMN
jgi:hypothetical protein